MPAPIYIGGTYKRITRQGVRKQTAKILSVSKHNGQDIVVYKDTESHGYGDCPLDYFLKNWELVKS
jgi:hypothetical protein